MSPRWLNLPLFSESNPSSGSVWTLPRVWSQVGPLALYVCHLSVLTHTQRSTVPGSLVVWELPHVPAHIHLSGSVELSGLGLSFFVTTLNSLRVRTSYEEKQMCTWLEKIALLLILEAGTSPGMAIGRAAPAVGWASFTEPLWPLSEMKNHRFTCTYVQAHSETIMLETQHRLIFLYSGIF